MAQELTTEQVDGLLKGACPDCQKKKLMQGAEYFHRALLTCDSCKTQFQVRYTTVGHGGAFGNRGDKIWSGERLAKMKHVKSVEEYLGVSK